MDPTPANAIFPQLDLTKTPNLRRSERINKNNLLSSQSEYSMGTNRTPLRRSPRLLQKALSSQSEYNEEHKLTPAKVGRVSQKRSTRKGRSGKKCELSKNMEACNKNFESSEDRENIITEPEEIVEVLEKVTEDILNATFEKEAEENLDVQIISDVIENQEVILSEKEIGRADTDVAVEAEAKDLISVAIEKERSMDSVVLKILSEGNELGCTPILYDVPKIVLTNEEHHERQYVGTSLNSAKRQQICGTTPASTRKLQTFEKEAVKILNVQIISDVIENQEVILSEKEIGRADTDVAVEAEAKDLISVAIEKERSMDSVVLKILSEGNELGCTPILYDVPKIVLTNEEHHERQYVGTSLNSAKRQQICGTTPASTRKLQTVATPSSTNKVAKEQPKGYRFPTPFKSKKDFRFGAKNENGNENNDESAQEVSPVLTTLEPKEIILLNPFSPKKSKVTTRTKPQNFAAIHEQQFKEIENLVDCIVRFINSALMARNAAAPSPAANNENPSNASKALILTSSNKDTSKAGRLLVLTPTKNNVSNIAKTNKSILDKLNQRTKRHMDMFKACPVESKSATGKNKDIIRGVRSNRRFELMMQRRKASGN